MSGAAGRREAGAGRGALSRRLSGPAAAEEKGPRRRKGAGPAERGETRSGGGEVTVESLHRVRTDFSPDALQKAVRFSADGTLLVTGGADGFLRLWEVGAGREGSRRRKGGGGAPIGDPLTAAAVPQHEEGAGVQGARRRDRGHHAGPRQ